MGDEITALARKYGTPLRRPPDLDKARAERRANVDRNIRQRLISETPAARNTDPETSHEAIAAVTAGGSRATNQRRVLEVVRRLPGLTYREIAMQAGLDRHETMKRLCDLKGDPERGIAPLVRQGAPISVGGARACVTWWLVE